MTRFKLFKGVLLGICISLLSTGAAFASESSMPAEPSSDTPISSEDVERYVGDDMVLEDGEFGITSIADDQERYVGDDIILEDGEFGITSITEDQERYVGDDLILGEGEMGIVSIEEGDNLLDDSSKMAESGMVTNTGAQSNSNNNVTIILFAITVVFLCMITILTVTILKRKRSIS